MKVILLNLFSITLGSFLGDRLKRRIRRDVIDGVVTGLGAVVIVLGALGISRDVSALTLILSYAVGGYIGFLLDLDGRLTRISDALDRRSAGKSGGWIAPGMNFFIISCSGAFTVNACFMAGMGDYRFLYTKVGLDLVMTLALSATMGFGVAVSILPTFVFEGGLYLLSGVLTPLMTEGMITAFASAGSLVAALIGANMVGAIRIKAVNLMPAVLLSPFIQMLVERLPL